MNEQIKLIMISDCTTTLEVLESCNGTSHGNGTCYSVSGEFLGIHNETQYELTTGIKRVLPAEEYYRSVNGCLL